MTSHSSHPANRFTDVFFIMEVCEDNDLGCRGFFHCSTACGHRAVLLYLCLQETDELKFPITVRTQKYGVTLPCVIIYPVLSLSEFNYTHCLFCHFASPYLVLSCPLSSLSCILWFYSLYCLFLFCLVLLDHLTIK